MPDPIARCEDCGFAWYGRTAADGLRALGHCVHCGGTIAFSERAQAPPDEAIDPHMTPYQILGPPRGG